MSTVVPMTPRRPEPLTDAEYHSLADFRYALRLFLAFSERAAREHGLTPAQHQLLLAVRGAEAAGTPASTSLLAERLQLKLHSAGELVERAADNGLVERHVDPDDRRRVLVTLTPAGRGRLHELSVLHRRELRRFRTEMLRLLDQLQDHD